MLTEGVNLGGRLTAAEDIRSVLTARIAKSLAGMRQRDAGSESAAARKWSWNWGYYGRSLSALYAATGHPECLHQMLVMRDALLASRGDVLKTTDGFRGHRILKTWTTLVEGSVRPGTYAAEVESTGLMLLPFTDLLLRVQDERLLPADIRANLLQIIVDGVEAHMPDALPHEPSGGVYFISPWTDLIEPLNHSHLYGALVAEAYALTGRADFRSMAERIYAFFQYNWHYEDDGTVSWAYRPTPTDPMTVHAPMRYGEANFAHGQGAEYFYKAAITIELPAAMARAGILRDIGDLRLIATSIHRHVFSRADVVSYYGSPRKVRLSSDDEIGRSIVRPHHLCNFDLLTPYAPEIGRDIEQLVKAAPDLLPKGWASGPSGYMAISRRLAAEIQQFPS